MFFRVDSQSIKKGNNFVNILPISDYFRFNPEVETIAN